mmetsp:Transcript_14942/g.32118  ORF Transcript_14942/g.32118 Transcript_14942/m.32118 type:complete len:218 (-) Transcript_14942:1744-2397(-)
MFFSSSRKPRSGLAGGRGAPFRRPNCGASSSGRSSSALGAPAGPAASSAASAAGSPSASAIATARSFACFAAARALRASFSMRAHIFSGLVMKCSGGSSSASSAAACRERPLLTAAPMYRFRPSAIFSANAFLSSISWRRLRSNLLALVLSCTCLSATRMSRSSWSLSVCSWVSLSLSALFTVSYAFLRLAAVSSSENLRRSSSLALAMAAWITVAS